MKGARVWIALVTALVCAHAAAGLDAGDSKEAPARNAGGLPHFESAVLSGNQTKSSAYRRVSTAKDPEAPASARDGKPQARPSELPRRKAPDKAKGG
jgi:hypothetical protein